MDLVGESGRTERAEHIAYITAAQSALELFRECSLIFEHWGGFVFFFLRVKPTPEIQAHVSVFTS